MKKQEYKEHRCRIVSFTYVIDSKIGSNIRTNADAIVIVLPQYFLCITITHLLVRFASPSPQMGVRQQTLKRQTHSTSSNLSEMLNRNAKFGSDVNLNLPDSSRRSASVLTFTKTRADFADAFPCRDLFPTISGLRWGEYVGRLVNNITVNQKSIMYIVFQSNFRVICDAATHIRLPRK